MPEFKPLDILTPARALSAADYAGTVRSYFPYWDSQIRPFLLEAVRVLPKSGFDFKPSPEMLTAREMIVHVAETEYGWLSHGLDGDPYEEWVIPKDDADLSKGWKLVFDVPDHAAMFALLEKWHARTQVWLERPAAEISRVHEVNSGPRPKRRCTLHWVLSRLQEHDIHHRGQLNTYLRLMGVTPPSI